MKKCPYCGHENDDKAENCERCYAGISAEKQDKKPVKADKKQTRSEDYGS